MQDYRLPVLLFVAVFGLVFLALRRLLAAGRAGAATAGGDNEDGTPPPTLLEAAAPELGDILPMTARGRADLRQALRQAGHYRATAVAEFALVRALLVVLPLLAGGTLALLVPTGRMPAVLVATGIAAVLGFCLPRLYVAARGRRRARQIEKGLPFAIDLLSLALSAGQTTLTALRLVSRELRVAHPVLAEELAIVHEHAQLSTVAHALEQFADRVAVPDVRSLAVLVGQSERLGADIGTGLYEFSRHQRTNMRQEAEARANRASLWMMFPSVGCLWVAGALVLVGPLYVQFREGWARMAEQTAGTKLTVEKASRARQAGTPVPAAPIAGPTLP